MLFDWKNIVEVKQTQVGTFKNSILRAVTLLLMMWFVFWLEYISTYDYYKLGILPKNLDSIFGIFLMPLIHSKSDLNHILNNSLPTLVLVTALYYFYRAIATKVLVQGWLLTGLLLWIFAYPSGGYHIGMSGVIYMLAFFLFFSGVWRRYKPLQGISLLIVFVYGSMVWGIFPLKEHVSWEGHGMGALAGFLLAFLYKGQGPQRPKYRYEIEKEMGIEPPDFEAIYWQQVEEEKRQMEQPQVIYHFRAKEGEQTDNSDR